MTREFISLHLSPVTSGLFMWNQLQIKATAANAELISDLLLNLDAVAVTLLDAKDQPLLEPGPGETPLWNEIWVSGLFTADVILNEIIEKLIVLLEASTFIQDKTQSETFLEYRIVPLEDQNWTRAWLAHFHPLQFGKRLWVSPIELANTITAKNAVIVLLDPGLAFGTGTHPTTALCLEWLDQYLQAGMTVIDYGCGSGILAIAALKLGAKKVWAIDNDPQALIATQENASRNQINLEQLCVATPAEFSLVPIDSDVLIANILAAPLIELAPIFAQTLKPQGKIVLSGILPDQADQVVAAYKNCFHDFSIEKKNEWARITAEKNTCTEKKQ